MASDKEKYEIVEKAAREVARHTQARTDIDQDTKNKILARQGRQLDDLRKVKGIKD